MTWIPWIIFQFSYLEELISQCFHYTSKVRERVDLRRFFNIHALSELYNLCVLFQCFERISSANAWLMQLWIVSKNWSMHSSGGLKSHQYIYIYIYIYQSELKAFIRCNWTSPPKYINISNTDWTRRCQIVATPWGCHINVMSSQITGHSTVCLTTYIVPHQRNIKVRVTGPFWGEFTGEFPAQRVSDVKILSFGYVIMHWWWSWVYPGLDIIDFRGISSVRRDGYSYVTHLNTTRSLYMISVHIASLPVLQQ